jgi:alginate O-acetyltransferase complex protein AlgI
VDILSLQFAAFAITAAVIYHLLPWGWKRGWLLLISYGFYAVVDIRYVLVLLLLTTINYVFAVKSKTAGVTHFYSSAALLVNLLSFGLLKWLTSPYAVFLGVVNWKWLLPVGFSFYLLQLISFQIDIRHKKISEMPSFIDFALYLAYFPKLLSGPIEKPTPFLQRVKNPLLVTNEVIGKAFGLILNGLVRKLLIANLLQILVSPIFVLGIYPNWMSVFAYAILLYNDFLGYTSVVRGVSLFFGIELSSNFQQPYLARNFSEFWSHWHISLTVWLRETIYFPLSRKLTRINSFTGKIISFVIPPLITMLASGLWHGVTLAMLVWGFGHGILLIIERLIFEKWPEFRPTRLNFPGQIASRVVTFLFVCLGWVPFSSPGLEQSIEAMGKLILRPVFIEGFLPILPIILIIMSFLLDIAAQRSQDELWWQRLAVPVRAIGMVVCFLILVAAITYQNQEPVKAFIYQGF